MDQASPQGEPTIPMICATGALKTGPVRIGHIAGNITLPRTIALPTLIGVVLGGLIGLIFAAVLPVGGIQKWVFGPAFGGGIGWFITTFSPMRGESLMTWMGLQFNTMRRQRFVDGEPVLVAVGSGVVGREVVGRAVIVRSAVRVTAGRWDDRGVHVGASFTGADLGGPAAPSIDLAVPASLQATPGSPRTPHRPTRTQAAAAAAQPAPTVAQPSAGPAPYSPPAAQPFPTGPVPTPAAAPRTNPFAQPPPASPDESPSSRRRGRR